MPKTKRHITTAVMALLIIAIALSLTTFAAISEAKAPPPNGKVTGSADLGVYSNSACTTPLSSINWGNLTAGGKITQTIYIKNTSNSLALTLRMGTSNWTPTSANGPITLTWNQEGKRLQPGQSVAATLTLTVSSNIADVTNFSVQISITGTN